MKVGIARHLVSSVVGVSLIAGILSFPVPAMANEASLTVARWDADVNTGVVSFDVTLRDLCATSSCSWKIEGFHIDAGLQSPRVGLGSGTQYASSGSPVDYTKQVTGTMKREITHVMGTVTTSSGQTRTTGYTAVSDPYPDGSVSITVNSWDRNVDTGLVSYDLALSWQGAGQYRGPCEGYCSWLIEALYRNGTVEKQQKIIGSGDIYTSSTWTSTKAYIGTSNREITHVRATLRPMDSASTNERYTTLIPVSDLYPSGSINVSISQWDVNYETGVTAYDFTMSWKGAGRVGGPCEGYCSWSVEALYRNGSVERQQKYVGGGDNYSAPGWSYSRSFVGSLNREVTHLRATVRPMTSTSPNETYSTTISVSDLYPDGSIQLKVNKWLRSETGSSSYDLSMSWVGAGQVGGPCESYCSWRVEGLNVSDGVETSQGWIASGDNLAAPGWSFTRSFTGSLNATSKPITHLRAVVRPYSSTSPNETFMTTVFVGDHIVGGDDIVSYEAVLGAALVADPSNFCVRLSLEGSGLPNTNGTSPPDAWEACESAIQLYGPQIRKVLYAVATATGGALALDLLLDEHANDGPVPTPEEEATPAPPWNPPEGWDDNGCYWQSIHYTSGTPTSSEEHLKKNGHIYEYRKPGKSWFYPWVTPKLKALAETHALHVMPEPDPTNPLTCRRIVTHLSKKVGVDRTTKKSTHEYTVVTWKDTGEVLTMFPGRP